MYKRAVCYIVYSMLTVAKLFGAPTMVNPINYGLNDARSDVERYAVLLRCHEDAVNKGYGVSYYGIRVLDIELPDGAETIPLPRYTDFAGVEMNVRTKGKSRFLFELSQPQKGVTATGNEIDAGDFRLNQQLSTGELLLIVEDRTPWVAQRSGYDYGATRRDVFHINNGISKERPVSSYSTKDSYPICRFCPVSSEKKVVKNLKIKRSPNSTGIVFCFKIENQYRVVLSNISIITPDTKDRFGDAAIQILNCVDVTLSDIIINGTYSQKHKYGYGVNADNVNRLTVERMYARANWGIFGTNNLSNVLLSDCDINRFDIHCYGSNIKATNCKFVGMYNQYSFIFGTVEYKNCEFTDFIPVLIESSYNAYTPFDLVFKGCTIKLNKNKNYLVTLFGGPENNDKERGELQRKCLPNITIKNSTIILEGDVDNWEIFQTNGARYKDTFDYIRNVTMKRVKVYSQRDNLFQVFSEALKTTNPVIEDIKVNLIKF